MSEVPTGIPAMQGPKILVIDDDEKMLGAVRRLLTSAGMEVITSSSSLELPKLVQREKPDLILLDIEMPTLSGEHVLDFTKLFDFLRVTPIVLHSAKSEEELQSLVARSNAIGYIKKTGNPLSLVAQVKTFLAKRG
jgi:two-component system, OmpR family, response regulator